MIRPILAAGSIALALAATPVLAQQSPTPPQGPAPQSPAPAPTPETPAPGKPQVQQLDPAMVGLAVYSSDGQKIGEVAEIGMAGGAPAIRAEMGEFLGLGATSVVIHADAFERKADRVEVSMTANEIKDTITKQRQQQKQQ
jgi:hypothetical protein